MNYGQGEKFAVVCGETSLAQYAPVTLSGSYANLFTDGVLDFYGINQDKPVFGDHFTALVKGESKVRAAEDLAKDDLLTTAGSGWICKAVSGSYMIGRCVFAASSGGIACAQIFGKPTYYNGL
jgi:hypothetical protein